MKAYKSPEEKPLKTKWCHNCLETYKGSQYSKICPKCYKPRKGGRKKR